MAERRMFAKTIIDSDAFIDMPVTARLLYYDLAMRADDDGFVNSPKKIMRMVGASEDDLRILIAKKFILPFDNGVVVIKHWRIHNYIRKDTYSATTYLDEKEMLEIDENKAYRFKNGYKEIAVDESSTGRGRVVDEPLTQVSIGKDRLGKVSIDNNKGARFQRPTLDEVKAYITEKGYKVDAERFVDYYESNGWKVGRNAMKDWKAAVRNWNKTDKTREMYDKAKSKNKFNDFEQRTYDFEDLETKLMNKMHKGATV